jgi:hypothetical protein
MSTPRRSHFLVEKCPEADRLVALLKQGPIKPRYDGPGVVLIDVDRIERPKKDLIPGRGISPPLGVRSASQWSWMPARLFPVVCRQPLPVSSPTP